MDSENFLRGRVDTEQKELNEREDEPYQVGELCVCSSEGMGWLHRYTCVCAVVRVWGGGYTDTHYKYMTIHMSSLELLVYSISTYLSIFQTKLCYIIISNPPECRRQRRLVHRVSTDW